MHRQLMPAHAKLHWCQMQEHFPLLNLGSVEGQAEKARVKQKARGRSRMSRHRTRAKAPVNYTEAEVVEERDEEPQKKRAKQKPKQDYFKEPEAAPPLSGEEYIALCRKMQLSHEHSQMLDTLMIQLNSDAVDDVLSVWDLVLLEYGMDPQEQLGFMLVKYPKLLRMRSLDGVYENDNRLVVDILKEAKKKLNYTYRSNVRSYSNNSSYLSSIDSRKPEENCHGTVTQSDSDRILACSDERADLHREPHYS